MPDQTQQTANSISNLALWIILIEAVIIVVLFCLMGSYSVKKTTDNTLQDSSTHSEAVTITKWQVIQGKAYPVTEIQSVHDTQYIKAENKTETITRSGLSLGAAYSTKGNYAGTLQADLLPFGPGNVQFSALAASNGEIYGGLGYRLNF